MCAARSRRVPIRVGSQVTYALGIDIGTSFSAAAVARGGRADMATLGHDSVLMPSLVFVQADGSLLVGEVAGRHGRAEPERLARAVKRRLGDTTPLFLGGELRNSEDLFAELLRSVRTTVVDREGGPPAAVTVTHPANWGPYKLDVFRRILATVDLADASLLTEPEAAALHYAGRAEERIGADALVGVYDLGGGTFDATVLRRTAGRYAIIGEPHGLEHLGGIDVDEAVIRFAHAAAEVPVDELDEDDPAVIAAMARLRTESVEAKEALSAALATGITVEPPLVAATRTVRITRAELEDLIAPVLGPTVGAMRRAIESAEVEPRELDRMLLVGGSSRIPEVGRVLGQAFGVAIAIDVHPKHAVALGAASAAATTVRTTPGRTAGTAPTSARVAPVPEAPVERPVRTGTAQPEWAASSTPSPPSDRVVGPLAPVPAPSQPGRGGRPAGRSEPRAAESGRTARPGLHPALAVVIASAVIVAIWAVLQLVS